MPRSTLPRVNSRFTRRAFLYGAGTTGLALPFLEGLPERSAFAAGEEDATFALFICTNNGVVQGIGNDVDAFWPSELGPLTKASMKAESDQRCTCLLSDHADRLLMVRGISHAQTHGGGVDTAAAGLTMCLTGLPFAGSSNKTTSTGPSADWVIARAAGLEPLRLYAGLKQGYINEMLSFPEAGPPAAAEEDPYQVYLQLAGLLDADGAPSSSAEELMLRRKSVNDLVRSDLATLKANPRLSQADRERLDLHLSAVREIEVSLSTMCTSRFLDLDEIETIGPDGFTEDAARLQMQLAGLAFSCNLTRAATLQWGDGVDQTMYEINGEKTHRFSFISNRVESDGSTGAVIPNAMEMHIEIDRIRMRTFKTLFDHWSQLTTPRGPLFDSALALWTNSKADGPSDSFNNLPVIIAGSPLGRLKQGQYLDASSSTGRSMGNLLTTLIEVCGVDASGFADDVGGLPDILA